MNRMLSIVDALVSRLPWPNPLRPSDEHDRPDELRLRLALEDELLR